MKQRFKAIIVKLLWLQVGRLRKKHEPLVVVVAGSIGKTSTKTAIATVLSQHFKVQWQTGNYNDIISVPLVFFGQKMPHIFNPVGWLRVFISSELQIQTNYQYNLVVLELGSDRLGDLDLFKPYLGADYAVLTGIAAEHMENFEDIDDVADEELTVAKLAPVTLVNTSEVAKDYQKRIKKALTYGEGPNDCRITAKKLTPQFKRDTIFTLKDGAAYSQELRVVGRQNLPAIAAAVLLASKLELTEEEIKKGIGEIRPVNGRMNPLRGIKGSLIIDDTYNSSPEAAIAALDSLYEANAKQKIAILGQMNELGKHSEKMHKDVGNHCDPKQLATVVTIGEDANLYLAAAAEKRGCKVMRCPSPYHAADIVRPLTKKGTLILAKGSQNGVFAEEAVKELLDDPDDVANLVRQSASWLRIKEEQFTQ